MSSMISLAKSFIKSNSMSKPTDKGQKIKIMVLSIFSMVFIMLPVLAGVGIMVKTMTEALTPVGFSEFGLQLMLYITCVFTVVFGINVLFSELYFVNDIEHILPLPLRAFQIVGAKFLSVCYMENIMQFMMILCCIIGYGIGMNGNMGILQWIIGVVGIMFMPIMPLAMCGIISIILMGFTRLVKSKDIIHKLTILLSFAVLVVVAMSITSLQAIDLGEIIEKMARNSEEGFGVLNTIFPTVALYVNAISKGSIVEILLYIIVNVLAVVVMLAIGEMLYFRGVIGLTTVGTKKKTENIKKIIESSKQKGVGYAYFLKELKILLRTPAYMTNCIGVNFIWPIFVYAVYKLKGFNYTIEELRLMYKNNEDNMQLIILLGVVGISILITALNSISSNSISREGKHFAFMKYIPVSYKIQWNVKAIIGGMFAAMGVLIYVIPACIIVKVPLLHTLGYVVLSLLFILGISYMGIYIDSIQPKLIWEDELGSLRENYNTFFSMAIAIGMTVVVCVGGYFLFKGMNNIALEILVLLGLIIIFNVIILLLTKKYYIKNIENQEEA